MFSISNHQFLSQSFWVAREHEWPRSRMRLHRDVPPSSLRINFEKVMFLALKIHTIYWERETWSSISLCRAKFNLRLQRLYISGSFHKISKPINICCRYSKWWWWWWWWWWWSWCWQQPSLRLKLKAYKSDMNTPISSHRICIIKSMKIIPISHFSNLLLWGVFLNQGACRRVGVTSKIRPSGPNW